MKGEHHESKYQEKITRKKHCQKWTNQKRTTVAICNGCFIILASYPLQVFRPNSSQLLDK